MCYIVLECKWLGIKKLSPIISAVKSKAKRLRHFKVEPVVKIYKTFQRSPESGFISQGHEVILKIRSISEHLGVFIKA